jgi:hypothetical protein
MRRYLLDTPVLLWWLGDNPKLRADTRKMVTDPNHDILVSAASIWEAAIKRAVGKLRFETPALRFLAPCSIELPMERDSHSSASDVIPLLDSLTIADLDMVITAAERQREARPAPGLLDRSRQPGS